MFLIERRFVSLILVKQNNAFKLFSYIVGLNHTSNDTNRSQNNLGCYQGLFNQTYWKPSLVFNFVLGVIFFVYLQLLLDCIRQ